MKNKRVDFGHSKTKFLYFWKTVFKKKIVANSGDSQIVDVNSSEFLANKICKQEKNT